MPTSVTVSRAGVGVHKTVIAEGAPLPMVAYVVESDREDPVAVRLLERLPDQIDRSDVALHDDYGGRHWRVGIDGVEFERRLAPDERVRTAFFVETGPSAVDALFVAPSIEDVRPVDAATAAPG